MPVVRDATGAVTDKSKPEEPKPTKEPEKKPHPYGEDTLPARAFDGRS